VSGGARSDGKSLCGESHLQQVQQSFIVIDY